jgi:ubiquinone/menaquinone biosynthesis C-methylase UbiE
MQLPRTVTRRLTFMLDELVPPILRDSKLLMWLPLRVMLGRRAGMFLDFKERAPAMTEDELADVYKGLRGVVNERATDLSPEALARVLAEAKGPHVLEVGCGGGFLATALARQHQVTACDVAVPPMAAAGNPEFVEATLPSLPWADRSFDTVVCAHTLEHLKDLPAALDELRRVTKQRLIVVLPKQRPYRYSFDLHLHFFPYRHSVLTAMGGGAGACEEAGGDWVYIEDRGRSS